MKLLHRFRLLQKAFITIAALSIGAGANADVTWDFNDGTMQGWENVLGHDNGVRPTENELYAWIVGGNAGLSGGADYRDAHQDMCHWTNVTYSPKFTLAAGASMTWNTNGGNTRRDTWENTPVTVGNLQGLTPFTVHNDQQDAFLGIALLRCTDDTFTASRWLNRKAMTAAEITTATTGDPVGTQYQVAVIDSYSGSWAHGRLNDLTILGATQSTDIVVKETRAWDVEIHAKEGVAANETVVLTGAPVAAPIVTGIPANGTLTATVSAANPNITITGTAVAADAGSHTVSVDADGVTSTFTLNVSDAAGTGYDLTVGAGDALAIDTRFGIITVNGTPVTTLSTSVEVDFETDAYVPTDPNWTRDWKYGTCIFWFDTILIDPAATVDLFGDNGLQLCSMTDINIGADLIANGTPNESFPDNGIRGGAVWGDDRNGGYTTLGSWGSSDRNQNDGLGAGGGLEHDLTPTAGGGGGGYGGDGGGGGPSGPTTPNTYGDVDITKLLPGSGGGSGANRSGGAGGGALGIKALGNVTISGLVTANGGDGRTNNGNLPLQNGGGGSGGAIRIQGTTVDVSGATIEARGGDSVHYGGGGGRIAILTTGTPPTATGTVLDVVGGAGGDDPGAAGSLKVTGLTSIVLNPDNPQTLERATAWVDSGVLDVLDDSGTTLGPVEIAKVTVDSSALDALTPGSYPVVYSYTAIPPALDSTATRTVVVVDTTVPDVTLVGGAAVDVTAGTGAWVDPGATALDPNGGEAVPVIQGSDQPDPGLALAKYAFEGNADDSTLNQLDLQTVGGPTFTTDTPFGLAGMSVDFNGSNNNGAFWLDDGTPNQEIMEIGNYRVPVSPDQLEMVGPWVVEATLPEGASEQNGLDFVVTNQEITDAVTADSVAATSDQEDINFGTGSQGKIGLDRWYPRATSANPERTAFRATGKLRVPVEDDYLFSFVDDDGFSFELTAGGAQFESPLIAAGGGAAIFGTYPTSVATGVNAGSFGSPAGDFSGGPVFTGDPLLEGSLTSGYVELGVAGGLTPDPTHNPSNTAAKLAVGGVGDTLNVPYDPGLNPIDADVQTALGIDAAAEFSVEMWVKSDDRTGTLCPVSNIWFNGPDGSKPGTRAGWLFYENGNNEYEFRVGDAVGYLSVGFDTSPLNPGTPAIVAGEWNHVVGVVRLFKPAGMIADPVANPPEYEADLYLNGQLANSIFLTAPPTVNADATIRLGATTQPAGGTGQNFGGCVDELALYPSALDAAAVLAHYNNGVNATRTQAYQDVVAADTPLGYWRLNDAAVGVDTSVTGILAPNNNGNTEARIHLTAGDYDVRYIQREGTGGNHAEVAVRRDVPGDTFWLALTNGGVTGELKGGPMAMSFFVKRDGWQGGSWDAWLAKRGEGGQGWKSRRFNNEDEATLTIRGTSGDDDGASAGSNTSIADGQWHHIAQLYDGVTRTQWVDGVEDFSFADTGLATPAVGYNFTIGAHDNNAAAGPDGAWYRGKMDEVCIYKELLTETQMIAHAAGGDVVDTNVPGVYNVRYLAVDGSGNPGIATREVTVLDNTALPVITLTGDNPQLLEATHDPYVDLGATLTTSPDTGATPLPGPVVVTGAVDPNVPGLYLLTYNYSDVPNGTALPKERIVEVVDTTAPDLALVGGDTIHITEGEIFVDPGATALDIVDGALAPDATQINPPPIIGNWTFDNDDAPDTFDGVKDSSGLGNHGELVGGTYITDVAPGDVAVAGGKALNLSAGDHWVRIEDNAGKTFYEMGAGPMTIACWVKGWPDGSWEPFVSKRGDGGQGWQLRRNSGSTNVTLTTRGAGNENGPTNAVPQDGQWHLLVGIHDGTNKRTYVDSGSDVSGNQSQIGSVTNAPNSSLMFGARDDNNNQTAFSRVRIDDVKIYRGALTPADIDVLATGADIIPYPLEGSYTVTYTVTDAAGNTSMTTRTVIVDAATVPVSPVITDISVAGNIATCTLVGNPDTTYNVFSSTDLLVSPFTTPEVTVPSPLTIDALGTPLVFTMDVTGDPILFIQAVGP